ncbi:MAG: PEP-CTERM sorting domain-containing protein [Opitutales bacterium]
MTHLVQLVEIIPLVGYLPLRAQFITIETFYMIKPLLISSALIAASSASADFSLDFADFSDNVWTSFSTTVGTDSNDGLTPIIVSETASPLDPEGSTSLNRETDISGDFTLANVGTFSITTEAFSDIGVVDTFNVRNNGLGVGSNNKLDGSELITFTFDTENLGGNLLLTSAFFSDVGATEEGSLLMSSSVTGETSPFPTIARVVEGENLQTISATGGSVLINDGDILTFSVSNGNGMRIDNLTFDVVAVPEPSEFALFASLIAVGAIAYRRRK